MKSNTRRNRQHTQTITLTCTSGSICFGSSGYVNAIVITDNSMDVITTGASTYFGISSSDVTFVFIYKTVIDASSCTINCRIRALALSVTIVSYMERYWM